MWENTELLFNTHTSLILNKDILGEKAGLHYLFRKNKSEIFACRMKQTQKIPKDTSDCRKVNLTLIYSLSFS